MTLSDAEIADLRLLLEVQAIQEVMLRYTRAMDRADSDLMHTIFWPEGFDDHGMYVGPIAGLFERTLNARDDPDRARHHLIGVPRVLSWEGAQAHVETYFIFTGVYGPGPNDNLGEVPEVTVGFNWGRYDDLFEKRDGEWKVLRRLTVYDVVLARPYEPKFDFFNIPLGINRGAVEPRDATYETK